VSARRLAPALITCPLTTSVAARHAVLERAEPPVESKLKPSPDEVKLSFTERLEPAYSSLCVPEIATCRWTAGTAASIVQIPPLLRATPPPLSPGMYRVVWRVLSIDAVVAEGGFTFSIE